MKPNRMLEHYFTAFPTSAREIKKPSSLVQKVLSDIMRFMPTVCRLGRCGRNSSGCNVVVMGESRNLLIESSLSQYLLKMIYHRSLKPHRTKGGAIAPLDGH